MKVDRQEFEELIKPVIEWLNNFHPHTKIIITNTTAEVVEGTIGVYTEEFLRD